MFNLKLFFLATKAGMTSMVYPPFQCTVAWRSTTLEQNDRYGMMKEVHT